MSRAEVIAVLQSHEGELRAAGVTRLSLFGSTARDQQGPLSDVDLLAAFDPARRISLLDVAGIALRLAELLGRQVDLVEEGAVKGRVRMNLEADLARAF